MTSCPASRKARATILAPRSWPSSPGLPTTIRIRLLLWAVMLAGYPRRDPRHCHGGFTHKDEAGIFRGVTNPLQFLLVVLPTQTSPSLEEPPLHG